VPHCVCAWLMALHRWVHCALVPQPDAQVKIGLGLHPALFEVPVAEKFAP
jgi:hypothetical protein